MLNLTADFAAVTEIFCGITHTHSHTHTHSDTHTHTHTHTHSLLFTAIPRITSVHESRPTRTLLLSLKAAVIKAVNGCGRSNCEYEGGGGWMMRLGR